MSPSVVGNEKKDLILRWEPLAGIDVKYEIKARIDGQTRTFTPEGTTQTIENVVVGRKYQFKIRGKNSCGLGPLSKVQAFTIKDKPSQMRQIRVITSKNQCTLLAKYYPLAA